MLVVSVRPIIGNIPVMEEFEAIRPYSDDEVPAVLARLAQDADLRRAVAPFLFPRASRALPPLGRLLTARLVRRQARRLRTVAELQTHLADYMENLIEKDHSRVPRQRLGPLGPRPALSVHLHPPGTSSWTPAWSTSPCTVPGTPPRASPSATTCSARLGRRT